MIALVCTYFLFLQESYLDNFSVLMRSFAVTAARQVGQMCFCDWNQNESVKNETFCWFSSHLILSVSSRISYSKIFFDNRTCSWASSQPLALLSCPGCLRSWLQLCSFRGTSVQCCPWCLSCVIIVPLIILESQLNLNWLAALLLPWAVPLSSSPCCGKL